jgi:hypothetical protein
METETGTATAAAPRRSRSRADAGGEPLNAGSAATSNPAVRRLSLALVVVAFGCSSSSEPSSSDDAGGDGAHGDAATDTAFDIDTAPPDNGCPLAYDPASIDCTRACANYAAWCEATPCKTPYCDKPSDCLTVCNATKSETGYTNALFGCAADNAQCAAYQACVVATCPTP